MKRIHSLLLMCFSVFTVLAQPATDTINIFQSDSARYCNLDSLYIDAGDGYVTYTWSTGESTSGIWITETNLYMLVAFDASGNPVSDSVYVNLITARILQPDTLICYGDTLLLSISQKLPECQVAYYPFTGDTKDYSGNGYHAYAFGASLVADRFGNPRSALSFNGTNNYMLATLGNIGSTLSIALWFRMPDTNLWYPQNENPTLFDFSDGQAIGQILGKNEDVISSGKLGRVKLIHSEGTGSPDNFSFESDTSPPFESWHHLYVVFDAAGSPNQIWIDGLRQGDLTVAGQILPTDNFIFFGRTNKLDKDKSYFIGRIDEVNIYSCVLDSLQIRNLIQTGSVFKYRYYWDTGDTGSVISVSPKSMETYSVTVTDDVHSCSDSVVVDVNPEIILEIDQLDMGCPGEEKAQALARVSGGTPLYTLEWDPVIKFLQGDTLALGLKDSVNYFIAVTDNKGCRIEETFEMEALKGPTVEFSFLPEEVYFQNPVVTFTSETNNAAGWSWNFGDGDLSSMTNPTHVFTKPESFNVVLTVTAENGCIDSVAQEIEIKEVELTVPNIFTPNGDGINDTFVITDLDKYISNQLVIFNRWGRKVFETNNYVGGEWDGNGLSDGVYYYLIKCQGYFSIDEFRGTLNIFTGGMR